MSVSNEPPVVIDAPDATKAIATIERGTPLPVFRGAEMTEALTAYRELQRALDAAMPDQIMDLDGRPFRKKGYWRAIAVAFNLTVEPLQERRECDTHFEDGRDNFGYVVTYRATAPNGRSATGDGSCFAVEKARRFKCPHPERQGSKRTLHFPHESCPDFDPAFQWRTLPAQATEHNIRSHAHTRAFNRAVSNLVGFGEVSAEEVERDSVPPPDQATGQIIDPPANPGDAPAGYHYVTRYRFDAPWHEATLLRYDAQGGSLQVSTKRDTIGAQLAQAERDQVPVKVDVTMRANTKGRAYLNKLKAYKPPPTNAEIDAEIAHQEQARAASEVL